MLLTAAFRMKFHYTRACSRENRTRTQNTHNPTKHPPQGWGCNEGLRYPSGGPGSHRKWSSQIRLSAGQMMRGIRRKKRHARELSTKGKDYINQIQNLHTVNDYYSSMATFDFLSKMINVQKESLVRMLFIYGLVWFMPLLL